MAIIGAGSLGMIALCFKELWAFATGTIGFMLGNWFAANWWFGVIQCWLTEIYLLVGS